MAVKSDGQLGIKVSGKIFEHLPLMLPCKALILVARKQTCPEEHSQGNSLWNVTASGNGIYLYRKNAFSNINPTETCPYPATVRPRKKPVLRSLQYGKEGKMYGSAANCHHVLLSLTVQDKAEADTEILGCCGIGR